jgi:transcription initiation factor TFIIIB Brf1 subunit/transcription initiation factor TFIIB
MITVDEYDFRNICLTCINIACKMEDMYISLEDCLDITKITRNEIITMEPIILKGLFYNLVRATASDYYEKVTTLLEIETINFIKNPAKCSGLTQKQIAYKILNNTKDPKEP